MSLDEVTRSHIVDIDSWDENYTHLKIQCRTKDRQKQHQAFGEALFNQMKSVEENIDENLSESISMF